MNTPAVLVVLIVISWSLVFIALKRRRAFYRRQNELLLSFRYDKAINLKPAVQKLGWLSDGELTFPEPICDLAPLYDPGLAGEFLGRLLFHYPSEDWNNQLAESLVQYPPWFVTAFMASAQHQMKGYFLGFDSAVNKAREELDEIIQHQIEAMQNQEFSNI